MDITKCTSTNCIYKIRCLRGIETEEDNTNIYQSWCNFELSGCDELSGFDDFIPMTSK